MTQAESEYEAERDRLWRALTRLVSAIDSEKYSKVMGLLQPVEAARDALLACRTPTKGMHGTSAETQ